MKNNYSLYIHIPFCVSKCSYCDFFSVPLGKDKINCQKIGIPDDYVTALCEELKERLPENKTCKSIYIGGGTPSLLSKNQLAKIINQIKLKLDFSNVLEFTIECNPDDINEDLLETFDSCGVNRISCGIQSLNNQVLKSLNRRAGSEENIKALDLLKEKWKNAISLDLISSLPGESEESFLQGLQNVIDYHPDHISLYSLTIEDETPLGESVNSGKIEYDFDWADDLWIKGRNLLIENGYNQYEISNFCRDNKFCIHNLTYWNHEDYIGIGCGATGTEYLNEKALRTTNINNIEKYISCWMEKNISRSEIVLVEEVDEETSVFEFFMMGLRTSFGINSKDFEKTFNKKIPEKVVNLFKAWEEKKYVSIKIKGDSVNYSMTTEGMLYLNVFLQNLDF